MVDLRKKLSVIKAMPLATGFILAEDPDPEEIRRSGLKLADLMQESCQRFETPLAVPIMDLSLEKHALCALLGINKEQEARFHFETKPNVSELLAKFDPLLHCYLRANIEAIASLAGADHYIAAGMSIGPFSLMTKLIADPITPVYLAGMGMRDESVIVCDEVLALSMGLVKKYIAAQLDAGAKIIVLAEPAANMVYLSPKQIDEGSNVYKRYILENLLELHSIMKAKGAGLFLHCCGDLSADMLKGLAGLEPLVLSLGSSRVLWEDEEYIASGTIIYGNLPSKKFFSNTELTVEDVYTLSLELLSQMERTRHDFILGTECDLLSVPGCHQVIADKIDAMYRAKDNFYSKGGDISDTSRTLTH